ncbi:hypothetical protein [Methylobrevis pamukkalensis]|uniref:Uncharacterized protein n=1 Tax=Methylobrevis pamukkalensis TaxID=1439726 RepID=A0A1E3H7B9_9HYPH|nr:hypothetical protein [Methylobrevis pamukkalensis]ODN72194.1 hypothetical protein A6302_00492 [Methylobrevis pamukkalensis]
MIRPAVTTNAMRRFGAETAATLDGEARRITVGGTWDAAAITAIEIDGPLPGRVRIVPLASILSAGGTTPPADPSTGKFDPSTGAAGSETAAPEPAAPRRVIDGWPTPLRHHALPFAVRPGDVVMVTDCRDSPPRPIHVEQADRHGITGRAPGDTVVTSWPASLVIALAPAGLAADLRAGFRAEADAEDPHPAAQPPPPPPAARIAPQQLSLF